MNRLLSLLTGVVALCAAVVTVTIVRREVTSSNIPTRSPQSAPREVKDWLEFAAIGPAFGPASAGIVITQFSDFQCPYCKRLHGVLERLEQKYPSEIRFVYRHFPIDRIHPHAREAAFASECAARLGKFRDFYDFLFERQDSIGKLPWGAVASRVGIVERDTTDFLECMKDPRVLERIREDSSAGTKLGMRGTPTILVNNWLLPGTPSFEKMDSLVGRLLSQER